MNDPTDKEPIDCWWTKEIVEKPLCSCGCGGEVKSGCKFAGHGCGMRYRSVQQHLQEVSPGLCPCGCGRMVKPGLKFAARGCRGHSILKREPGLCLCGCNCETSWNGKKFASFECYNRYREQQLEAKTKIELEARVLCPCGCGVLWCLMGSLPVLDVHSTINSCYYPR